VVCCRQIHLHLGHLNKITNEKNHEVNLLPPVMVVWWITLRNDTMLEIEAYQIEQGQLVLVHEVRKRIYTGRLL
jgi:hypothetical protein